MERLLKSGRAPVASPVCFLESGLNVVAYEKEKAMLDIARQYVPSVCFSLADARALPVASGTMNGFIAGWVFGHFRKWMPQGWQDAVGAALAQASRIVRPGGTTVIIETLGTGTEMPGPPNDALAEYYQFLENQGFQKRIISTDYRFESVETAATVMGDFFGDTLKARIIERKWSQVPEWTGLWIRS